MAKRHGNRFSTSVYALYSNVRHVHMASLDYETTTGLDETSLNTATQRIREV